MTFWIGIGVLVVGLVMLLMAGDDGSIGGLQQGQFAAIIALLSLLILYMGSQRVSRGGFWKGLKHLSVWIAAMLVLVLLYSFKDDFKGLGQRFVGELMPGSYSRISTDASGVPQVEIKRQSDGHFYSRAWINGASIDMLVDTGATSVALTYDDARRIGLPVGQMQFSMTVKTANGTARTAPVKLNAMSVEGIGFKNVRAHVAEPGKMDKSLLGMSFLSRLRSYEVSGGTLILRQ